MELASGFANGQITRRPSHDYHLARGCHQSYFFARDVFAMYFIIPAGMAAPFQGKKIEGKKINWLFAPDSLPGDLWS
jgi:hypothetical protein